MSNYKFEIGNHPSQARHPFSNDPLVDDDGQPVPLFPDQKTLRLDGQVIAYITSGGVQFVIPRKTLGVLYDQGLAFIEAELEAPKKVSAVPYVEDIIEDDD